MERNPQPAPIDGKWPFPRPGQKPERFRPEKDEFEPARF